MSNVIHTFLKLPGTCQHLIPGDETFPGGVALLHLKISDHAISFKYFKS